MGCFNLLKPGLLFRLVSDIPASFRLCCIMKEARESKKTFFSCEVMEECSLNFGSAREFNEILYSGRRGDNVVCCPSISSLVLGITFLQ